MQPKKNSAQKTSRFSAFKASAPLLGILFWCFAIWFEYVSMKSTVKSIMFTTERVSPEDWDRIQRFHINMWIHRHYLTGAILVLWLAYLVWKWVRAFWQVSS